LVKKSFNVLEHELVPQHVLLDKKTAAAILKKLGLKPFQLPWMYESDPAAKAVGAKAGDLIMIIRKSPTAGVSISFRYVRRG